MPKMIVLIFSSSHRYLCLHCQSKQIGHLVCCIMEQKLVRMWGRTLSVWKPLILQRTHRHCGAEAEYLQCLLCTKISIKRIDLKKGSKLCVWSKTICRMWFSCLPRSQLSSSHRKLLCLVSCIIFHLVPPTKTRCYSGQIPCVCVCVCVGRVIT